jgi:hypothetical protein
MNDTAAAAPRISAAGLAVMRAAAAAFLARQGTGHRDICDWPDPRDQHSRRMVSASDASGPA